jgi:LysM repeat protein
MTDVQHAAPSRLDARGAEAVIDERARAVFAGLAPRVTAAAAAPEAGILQQRLRAAALSTMPVVLTGAIALGVGVAAPADAAPTRKPAPPRPEQAPEPVSLRSAIAAIGSAVMPGALAAQTVTTLAAPAAYTVQPGDTVSSIAQRYGLATAGVLALNGLSWSSSIFPGQVLRLTTAPVKATGLPTPTTANGRYTIVKGDTLSALAARFGVTTQSIIDSNGLTWSSIVYPGQTIVIPGRVAAPTPAPAPIVGTAADVPQALGNEVEQQDAAPASAGLAAAVAAMPVLDRPALPVSPRRPAASPSTGNGSSPRPPSSGSVTPMSAEMRQNAAIIVRVGRELGVPEYGIVIALATAMQESSLRNISWGDRDSVGLFQQRPSSGWGTVAQIMDPAHAAKLFYVGRSGYTRGLLDIPGWQSMTLTRAAQAVQISAHPDAYAKWEASAWAWYYELT